MAKKKDGSTSFSFKDKVEVKGDIFSGDKNITYEGDTITNIQNIQSPVEFGQILEFLQEKITALKVDKTLLPAQKDEIEIVEGKITEVVEATQVAEPNGEEIRETLDDAKKTMDSIAGAITSAVGLGALLGQLAYMATQVFGG